MTSQAGILSASEIAQQKAQEVLKLYKAGHKTFSRVKLRNGNVQIISPNLSAPI